MKKLTLFLFALLTLSVFTACTGMESGLVENSEKTTEVDTSDKTDLNGESEKTDLIEEKEKSATDTEVISDTNTDTVTDIEKINNTTMQTTPEKGDTIATIKTTNGVIKMIVYTKQAPETAKNFIELANAKKYDGVIFHRVMNDFMIQTGDFEFGNGMGGYSYKGPGTVIEDEFGPGLKHIKGAVSMANRGPNTGGSQFFIVQKEDGTDWLNGKHAIFGYVFEGMDVVDAIAKVETDGLNKPLETLKIESINITVYE